MIAMTISTLSGCMLIICQRSCIDTQSDNTNSQPAAEQMNTTQAHTFETNIHPLQTLK